MRPTSIRLRGCLLPGLECDGFVIEKNCPDVVVFPRTAQHVSDIVRLANKHRVPFVPRGAGTSLAGGCLPVGGGIMIVLTRMKAIEEINLRDRYAVVQPGVVNAWSSGQYTSALRHDQKNPGFNSDLRQLLHVGFKVAAKMGDKYLKMLETCEASISRNVTENLFERHIKPLFLES